MIRTITRFIFILFVFGSPLLKAQVNNFRVFNEDNGLPQSYIYDISQDKEGFLIVSTGDGLCLYGGNVFKTYRTAEGMGENFMTTHFVDAKNNIWIGHYQEGMSLFDRKTNTIRKIEAPEMKSVRVNCITQDKQGTIWAGTFGKGVFRIGENLKAEHVTDIAPENITALYLNPDGNLLVGSNDGISMYYIKSSSGKPELLQEIESVKGMSVAAIRMAPDNSMLWAAVNDKGILSFRDAGQRYVDNSTISTDLGLKALDFRSICFDKRNNLWVASFGEGLRKIAFSDNEGFSYTVSSVSGKNGLINDYIQNVYCDYEGNTWIGTYGSGLVQMSDSKFILYKTSKDEKEKSIRAVTSDLKGDLWLGSEAGLRKFVPSAPDDEQTTVNGKLLAIGDRVITLYTDMNNLIWIGTAEKGVFTWDPVKQILVHLSENENLTHRHINSITGNKENILIATTEGLYVHPYGGKTYTLLETKDGLLHNNIYGVYMDATGKIWFACHGSPPFNYYKGKVTAFQNIPELRSFNLNSVCEDRVGKIWFASEGDGIFMFDGMNFHNFTVKDGLASNYCYSVINDASNTLWVGHKSGLSCKSSWSAKFTNYQKRDGVIATETNLNAGYADPSGAIWFGTTEGVMQYDQANDRPNMIAPIAKIMTMTINNTVTIPVADTVLPAKIYSIKFDFIGVSLTHPEYIRYRYILEGFESEWNLSGEGASTANYPRLADGDYTFRLFSCNSDGIWNAHPLSYSFHIRKPYWKNPFFPVSIVLFVVGLILLLFKWRTQRLRLRSQVLEKMVNEKTSLLQQEKEMVEKVNLIVKEQNRDITDSINYAKKIQDAMLPSRREIHAKIKAFIYFKPRDIVSGDFYWYYESGDKLILAVVDCTGHGVPGAFMSLIGTTLLKSIVIDNGITSPGKILAALNRKVIESLHRENNLDSANDGMEAIICSFEPSGKVIFAGAGRSLYVVRNQVLTEYSGGSVAIGGMQDALNAAYEEYPIDVNKDDMLYLTSDGFADQFGGEKNRKFSSKRMRELFTRIASLDIAKQEETLAGEMQNWKGDSMQIDDMLVIGIKI
jgi:ligand-binding sensor domain-containing protein/serine phosphatase RsbU (regulator of sigma subunit)